MARRKLAIEKVRRLEARTQVIQWAGRAVFVVACLALGFVVVATAIPQKRKLDELEAKLEKAKAREQEVQERFPQGLGEVPQASAQAWSEVISTRCC